MKYASLGVIIALLALPLLIARSVSTMQSHQEHICPISFLMMDMNCASDTDAFLQVSSHVELLQRVTVGTLSFNILILTLVCLAIMFFRVPDYHARDDLTQPIQSRRDRWRIYRSLALEKQRRWFALRTIPYLRFPIGHGDVA